MQYSNADVSGKARELEKCSKTLNIPKIKFLKSAFFSNILKSEFFKFSGRDSYTRIGILHRSKPKNDFSSVSFDF